MKCTTQTVRHINHIEKDVHAHREYTKRQTLCCSQETEQANNQEAVQKPKTKSMLTCKSTMLRKKLVNTTAKNVIRIVPKPNR